MNIESSFETIASDQKLSPDWKELLEKAKLDIQRSYSPYSHFNVVAVVRLEDGRILSGSNQENSSFQAGICAERNIVFHCMHEFPEVKMKQMLIMSSGEADMPDRIVAPCGICRQVLAELEHIQNNELELLFPGGNGQWILSKGMHNLLPFAFRLK